MTDSKSKRSDEQPAKLNADIQSRIGHELRSTYDDLLSEGVPDKFADLIQQLDGDPTSDTTDDEA